jgi:hypothetical protein
MSFSVYAHGCHVITSLRKFAYFSNLRVTEDIMLLISNEHLLFNEVLTESNFTLVALARLN